jgi:hypothetical protein
VFEVLFVGDAMAWVLSGGGRGTEKEVAEENGVGALAISSKEIVCDGQRGITLVACIQNWHGRGIVMAVSSGSIAGNSMVLFKPPPQSRHRCGNRGGTPVLNMIQDDEQFIRQVSFDGPST